MDNIDSRLLKWFEDLMLICRSNMELWKSIKSLEGNPLIWDEIRKINPGLNPPPVPFDSIQEMHRQWLSLYNAVPRYDYDTLQERLDTVEAECEKLRTTLQELTTAMVDLENLPKKMAPWLELAQNAMQSHMEWLGELGKNWQSMNKPKESLEKSDKES
jgi:hypothetical protein